jgi:hypothetical protein
MALLSAFFAHGRPGNAAMRYASLKREPPFLNLIFARAENAKKNGREVDARFALFVFCIVRRFSTDADAPFIKCRAFSGRSSDKTMAHF